MGNVTTLLENVDVSTDFLERIVVRKFVLIIAIIMENARKDFVFAMSVLWENLANIVNFFNKFRKMSE